MASRVTITLSDEAQCRIERAAEKEGLPVATLVARAVEAWVERATPVVAPPGEGGVPFYAVRQSLEERYQWPESARRERQGSRRASRALSGDVSTSGGASGGVGLR
jgi:hypothetical protein